MIEEQRVLFQECRHERTLVIPEKRSSVHHARVMCAACKKFIRWLPKPATIEQQNKNLSTLALLIIRDDLDEWARHFVRSISGVKHLSPKQQKALDQLRLKYLEDKP